MNPERPLKNALILVLVGAALGIGSNVLHPHPIPWKPEKKQTVTLEDDATGNPAETGTPADGGDMDGNGAMAGTPTEDAPADPADGGDLADAPGNTAQKAPAVPDFKPMKTGFGRGEDVPKTDLYADIPQSEFPIEISTGKAKAFYDRGGLLVLDAREREEYEEGHIKGAVHADADKVVADMAWLEKTAADPRPILVYCDGGDCELSLDLGFEITRAGHHRVLVYKDGYPAWVEAGYPVETGDTP